MLQSSISRVAWFIMAVYLLHFIESKEREPTKSRYAKRKCCNDQNHKQNTSKDDDKASVTILFDLGYKSCAVLWSFCLL